MQVHQRLRGFWRSRRVLALSIFAACSTLVAFGGWYLHSPARLRPDEVDRYIERVRAQTDVPGGRHDLVALRRFLTEDDGQPFYTVNLYKFRARAQYEAGVDLGGSGRDAYDRFSRVMVPLLARHGSHPVFGTSWTDSSDWDRLVIVRYRSRRDIAEMFASAEFAAGSAHKWASIEKHERMQVQGRRIPEGWLLPTALAAALGLVVYLVGNFFAWVTKRWRGRGRVATSTSP